MKGPTAAAEFAALTRHQLAAVRAFRTRPAGTSRRRRRQARPSTGPAADEYRVSVAAVEHGSGIVRGQFGSASAGGEIPGVGQDACRATPMYAVHSTHGSC